MRNYPWLQPSVRVAKGVERQNIAALGFSERQEMSVCLNPHSKPKILWAGSLAHLLSGPTLSDNNDVVWN